MKTVVFVGPSLAGEIPESTDDFTVLPPAQMGDVLGAATEGAWRIVLIDGYFGQHLSVWHKEIVEALRLGVDVIGAASMGALRALECEAYGMRGVGRVFAMYKQGLIERDDEVALGAPCLSRSRPRRTDLHDFSSMRTPPSIPARSSRGKSGSR